MIQKIKDIESPKQVKADLPFSGATYKKEIADIVSGKKKDRIIAIVGPCSADNPAAVLDYYRKLKQCAEDVRDKVLVVGRVYTCKPRTISTAEQYFGLVEKPTGGDGAIDYANGIKVARQLMSEVANLGFPVSDEMLYPENFPYFDDVLSLSVIGARCSEDQFHRQVGSGIDMPLGVKNPTSGDIDVMSQSIQSSASPQEFMYRGEHVKTDGNPACFAVMRGGKNGPNYHYEDLIKAYKAMINAKGTWSTAVVDCNHANSGKDPMLQRKIAKEIIFNKFNSERLKYFISGIMVESYIKDGVAADYDPAQRYGASITDPCLGLEKTVKLLYDIADTMRSNEKILTGEQLTHD